jgi:4'-phosphopantetheinyl transferase EntD
VPIPRGPRGAPNWPTGVVGSMTHCDGYRAATVAREREIASLGIDAEPASPLPEGTFGMVALGPEREHLAALTVARPGIAWDRLLFCAKESVYKAWFPLTGRWLGFEEAQVELNLTDHPDDPGNRAESGAEGTFTARLLVPGPSVDGRTVDRFSGRWLMHDGIVAAAVIVEH